jgi:integrase
VRRRLADGSVKEYRYPAFSPQRHERYAPDSIAALVKAYQRSPEWAALAPASRSFYAIYIRDIEGMGAVRATDLKRREILEVRDAIRAARGPAAAQAFIRTISTLFSWGVEREWVEHNPASSIKALPGGHLRAWTRDEAARAIELLPEYLRRVVILALYTGQRRGDLAVLPWSAFDGETIRLKQQKTGVRLAIPAHPTLKAHLKTWREGATSPVILTNHAGLPWNPKMITQHMARALAVIGLPRDINVHGLRKLAAANLADFGCSVHEIAAITGHKTLAMVQFYTQSADQERLAVAAIHRLQTRGNKRHK